MCVSVLHKKNYLEVAKSIYIYNTKKCSLLCIRSPEHGLPICCPHLHIAHKPLPARTFEKSTANILLSICSAHTPVPSRAARHLSLVATAIYVPAHLAHPIRTDGERTFFVAVVVLLLLCSVIARRGHLRSPAVFSGRHASRVVVCKCARIELRRVTAQPRTATSNANQNENENLKSKTLIYTLFVCNILMEYMDMGHTQHTRDDAMDEKLVLRTI